MDFETLTILFVFVLVTLLILKFNGMDMVKAQGIPATGTTANVTISGYLDSITVKYIPIAFSNSSHLAYSDGDNYPKVDDGGRPDITIELDENTNVDWYFHMNVTDLIDDQGHVINITDPSYLLEVDTDCGGDRTPGRIALDYSLVPICDFSTTGQDNPIGPLEVVSVQFFLTVPKGTYNNTFKGNFSIWANSTDSSNDVDWFGINQVNVTIQKNMELTWTLAPISFGTLTPRLEPYNATDYIGFPTNLTVTASTNIFVDLYINGTDLVNTNQQDFIAIGDNGNVTYSNATGGVGNEGSSKPTDWPSTLNKLSYELPPSSTNGDFANWHMIGNRTHTYSYWNMTVPGPLLSRPILPGTYVANISATIVDAGSDPT